MYTEKELKAKHRRLKYQFKGVWDELTPGFEDNTEYREIRESLVKVNEIIRNLKEGSKGDLFYKNGSYICNYDLPLEWYSKYDVSTVEKIISFFINRQEDEREVAELFSTLIGRNYDLDIILKVYEDCEIRKGNGYVAKGKLFYAISELIEVGFDISDIKQMELLKELLSKVYFKHVLYSFKKVLNNQMDLIVLKERLCNNKKFLYNYDKRYKSNYNYGANGSDNEDNLYLDTLLGEDEDRYSLLCDFLEVAKYRAVERKKFSNYSYNIGPKEEINVVEEIEKEYKKFLFNPLYIAFQENRTVTLNDLKNAYKTSELVKSLREDREKEISDEGLRILKIGKERGENLEIIDIKSNVDNAIFSKSKMENLIEKLNQEVYK